jgi:extradiol dioxygenase family protein
MEVTKKVWVKLKSPSGDKFEVIFNVDTWFVLSELLEKNGFKDYKVIEWKLKRVVFIS